MTETIGSERIGLGLVAGLCLALGACNGAGDAGSTSLEQSVPSPASKMQAVVSPKSSAQVAPVAAVAALPADAGAVASVRGHGYANGFRQDILLKGGAVRGVENGLTVMALTSKQTTLDESTPLFKPTEAAIRSELGRTFPHISMQVVERSSSNAYGPYGLALGRAGGNVHCIYAWQWVDEAGLGKETGLAAPVALRIRLCKSDTTFDALAALVDHLSIRRDASADGAAEAVVAPPVSAESSPKPRKHVAARRTKPTRTAAIRQDAASAEAPTSVSTPVSPQPLAMDLPPQAYLGPNARSSNAKPIR